MAYPNASNQTPTSVFSSPTSVRTNDQNVLGLLSGVYWQGPPIYSSGSILPTGYSTAFTYSFPTSSADYGTGFGTGPGQYDDQSAFTNFSPATPQERDQVKRAFDLISSYTDLTFTPIDGASNPPAVIRVADGAQQPGVGAHGDFPYLGQVDSGDLFYGPTIPQPQPGNYGGITTLHELGHTLGLKHGDDPAGPFGLMNADKLDQEYSVMNYQSYIGATANETAGPGDFPQTYMMYDIAALQWMYGANFGNVGTNQTYTWDPNTGEESINGVAQGVPATGKIFETVWTGGLIAPLI
jgi:serralysin